MSNYFIKNIPISHFVHQAFAKCIDAVFILPAPKKTPFVLIPLYSQLKIILNLKKYDSKGTYFCEGFAGLYFASILKIFKSKIKIVYHDADALFYRDYPKFNKIKKRYINFFLSNIDFAISDSKISKKYLEKSIKLKKPSVIVYPFVKTEEIKFTPNLDSKNIIYVGRFAREKNLFRLIDAFSELTKKTDSKLYLVGDGPLKKQLRNKINKMNLSNKVIFTGWVSDIRPYLKKCILGFNVSDFEPFGCSGLEFALAGVIPLLGDRNGNAEVLKTKQVICNPDKVKDITNKMISLIDLKKPSKTKLLKELKLKADKFNEKTQCAKFKKEFERLIK